MRPKIEEDGTIPLWLVAENLTRMYIEFMGVSVMREVPYMNVAREAFKASRDLSGEMRKGAGEGDKSQVGNAGAGCRSGGYHHQGYNIVQSFTLNDRGNALP